MALPSKGTKDVDAELLLQGLELLLLGMGIVFGFLTLLVFLLRGMSSLAGRLAPMTEPAVELPAPAGAPDRQRIVAVISAAVARYRRSQHPDRPDL